MRVEYERRAQIWRQQGLTRSMRRMWNPSSLEPPNGHELSITLIINNLVKVTNGPVT